MVNLEKFPDQYPGAPSIHQDMMMTPGKLILGHIHPENRGPHQYIPAQIK
jgi:hypothetical protein